MPRPLVSIIIPCFNSAEWIEHTIESVLSQTWTEKEIIVVDDGSTDKTREILSEYEDQLQRLIFQENRGAAAARNSGMRHAKGEYIQFLDSDDLLDSQKIELQIQELLKYPGTERLASCSWGRFAGKPGEAAFCSDKLWQDLDPIDWLITAWHHDSMMHPASWLTPRMLIQQAGEWDESLTLNDDGEFFCRVIAASKKVCFVPEAKSYYRSNIRGSLSASQNWDSLFRSFLKSIETLFTLERSERTEQAAADLMQRFIYTTYPSANRLRQEAQRYIQEYGGSQLPPPGGARFQLLSRLIGWKITKRIQRMISR